MPQEPAIKRLPQNRVECTLVFTKEEVAPAEQKALAVLGKEIEIPGFRPGKAPEDALRERIRPEALLEETIHTLLPESITAIVKANEIKPIMHPKIEIKNHDPLTLTVTFVQKPDVKLKGIAKIKIAKKEAAPDAKEVKKMVAYVLQQHQTSEKVARAAKEGDRITMDFHGTDEAGTEIPGIRATGHQIVLGSKTLIPGFEDQLAGMKEGDAKSFTLIFPEKYHAEALQKKPVTFHVTVAQVEEVRTPELSDAFAKEQLGEESAQAFRKRVEDSMRMQEEQIEHGRREQELLEEIRKATQADLAPELLEEETMSLIEEFARQLERRNQTIEDWLKQTGKNVEEWKKELKDRAEKRLTLRLGMEKLIEEKNAEISDEDMNKAISELFADAADADRERLAPSYAKGERAYEQLKWQKKVEKVIEEMLA